MTEIDTDTMLPDFTAFAAEVGLTTGQTIISDVCSLAEFGLTTDDVVKFQDHVREMLSSAPDKGGDFHLVKGRTWYCIPLRTVAYIAIVTSDDEESA